MHDIHLNILEMQHDLWRYFEKGVQLNTWSQTIF